MGMKLLITENMLKKFLEDKIGVDLRDKIYMVTSKYDMPFEFDTYFGPKIITQYLNLFGPMYLIYTPKGIILYQRQESNKIILLDKEYNTYSEQEIMYFLGIPPLGLKIDDLIDIYM